MIVMKREILVTYSNIIRSLMNDGWMIYPDGWSRSNIENIIFLIKDETKIALSLEENDDFLSDEYGELNIYEYTYELSSQYKTLHNKFKIL